MKKIIIAIVVLLILGIGVYYFINNKQGRPEVQDNSISNTSTTTTTTTTTIETTSSVTVSMKNFVFNPQTLNIKAGTKVIWINNDNVDHTVTSDTEGIFDSGTMSPGESFSFTFNNLESVNYHCNFHRMMKGIVIVQ